MVPELDPAPINSTYLRVQHIGDPGTPELAGEIANPVTWDVGQLTGFFPPRANHAQAQRGFRDKGPPDPASAFQLWCNGAGFLINTRQFKHAVSVALAGPNVSVARDLSPAAEIFRNATSALTIDGYVRVPFVEYGAPPTTDGTAQVNFFYYAQDVRRSSPGRRRSADSIYRRTAATRTSSPRRRQNAPKSRRSSPASCSRTRK
jgi:hypothetical protein